MHWSISASVDCLRLFPARYHLRNCKTWSRLSESRNANPTNHRTSSLLLPQTDSANAMVWIQTNRVETRLARIPRIQKNWITLLIVLLPQFPKWRLYKKKKCGNWLVYPFLGIAKHLTNNKQHLPHTILYAYSTGCMYRISERLYCLSYWSKIGDFKNEDKAKRFLLH